MKKEFKIIFQVNKLVIFNVSYYTLSDNKNAYFATSAFKYIKSKKDIEQGGQCQSDVLSGKSLDFYNKYDYLHLKDLTNEEYENILNDIQILKDTYNYIEEIRDTFKNIRHNFSNMQEKELSMLKLKKIK